MQGKKAPLKLLIGIDDTDNLDSRGTGFQARTLGMSLVDAGLYELRSITRHQLLVSPEIPYTSHNSSACLEGKTLAGVQEIIDHCKEFLLRVSAFDSDAGLCVCNADQVVTEIVDFGNQAKREVLKLNDAIDLAHRSGIYLEGFLNTRMGMIGSLAAVGLRKGGCDGRLLWTKNLRESTGVYRVSEYMQRTGIEAVTNREGIRLQGNSTILVTDWTRPVMLGGLITLLADPSENNIDYEYQSAPKELIKSISG